MDLAHQANLQDHTLGPLTAKVVLVEYADYQCPLSGRAHLIVKDVVGWYRNLVCFVYRHYPRRHEHPFSHLAGLAIWVERKFFLRDTGRKLRHLDQEIHTGQSELSDEILAQFDDEEER